MLMVTPPAYHGLTQRLIASRYLSCQGQIGRSLSATASYSYGMPDVKVGSLPDLLTVRPGLAN
jgi:hypothetical protein